MNGNRSTEPTGKKSVSRALRIAAEHIPGARTRLTALSCDPPGCAPHKH